MLISTYRSSYIYKAVYKSKSRKEVISMNDQNFTPETKPISPWGYIGYEILFAIPLVGLIITIVFAITQKNINVKNFARAQLCMILIVFICYFIIAAVTGASLSDLASNSMY